MDFLLGEEAILADALAKAVIADLGLTRGTRLYFVVHLSMSHRKIFIKIALKNFQGKQPVSMFSIAF